MGLFSVLTDKCGWLLVLFDIWHWTLTSFSVKFIVLYISLFSHTLSDLFLHVSQILIWFMKCYIVACNESKSPVLAHWILQSSRNPLAMSVCHRLFIRTNGFFLLYARLCNKLQVCSVRSELVLLRHTREAANNPSSPIWLTAWTFFQTSRVGANCCFLLGLR